MLLNASPCNLFGTLTGQQVGVHKRISGSCCSGLLTMA